MDGDALLENVLTLIKKIPHRVYLPLALGLIGCVFLFIGLIQLLKPSPASTEVPLETVSNTPSSAVTIQVDIEGAVEKPGVYHLQTNARLQDALIAAGGMSAGADREFIAQKMNLASKLVDGGKIYVPRVSDITQNQETKIMNTLTDTPKTVLGVETGLIDINSATVQELDSLPGVGQVTAGKIINGRPYRSADDLLTKKVISQKVYGEIQDKITVN